MFKKHYQTLNRIEISSQKLLDNLQSFQKLNPQAKICPVLKSNAYGHGLKLISQFVDRQIKPEFICVDSLFEAYELRKFKIKSPILIMGYTFPQNFTHKKINFHLPVWDIETLKILNKNQPGIKVQIKIDTGMNRLGLKENDLNCFIAELLNCSKVCVEGIYSHLADAKNEQFSQKQISLFKKIIQKFESAGFKFKYKHICATEGALRYHDPEFNLIRLGLGFYDRALKLMTHIVQLKEVLPGEFISYDRTFRAKKKMTIAILPIGYYDGLDRRLSNQGRVKIAGQDCCIQGRVCMNIVAVDVSKIKNVRLGDEVVVFENVEDIAQEIGTIPYELLVNLSETTKRILI